MKKLPGKTKVIWKSSNAKVATVNNGTVTGISTGTAVITAKAGAKKATCKVTVVWGKEAKKAIKAYQKFMAQDYIDWSQKGTNPNVPRDDRKISDFTAFVPFLKQHIHQKCFSILPQHKLIWNSVVYVLYLQK